MKKWIKIIAACLSIIGIFVLVFTVNRSHNNTVLSKPKIIIQVDGENAFLTEKEILNRLLLKKLVFKGQKKGEFKIQETEGFIRKMSEVKNCRVFSVQGGVWQIEVELRAPIARVFNVNKESFYLDKDGYIINGISTHTARVLLFSGNIKDLHSTPGVPNIINNESLKSKHIIDDIYRISNYVCNDAFFQALIGQVFVNDKNEFVLIPIIGDQLVQFGSAASESEVKNKFDRLKIFYNNAMSYEGWNKYSEIILKYDGQIVCKKSNKWKKQ